MSSFALFWSVLKVEYFTIREIEDALKDQRTWDAWKNNLKSKYDNETEEGLDELFKSWRDLTGL